MFVNDGKLLDNKVRTSHAATSDPESHPVRVQYIYWYAVHAPVTLLLRSALTLSLSS